MKQVRVMTFAASRRQSAAMIEAQIAREKAVAIDFYTKCVAGADIDFIADTQCDPSKQGVSTRNPRSELADRLKDSYVVTHGSERAEVTKADVLKAQAIFDSVLLSGTANNAAVITMGLLKATLAEALQDLRDAEDADSASLPARHIVYRILAVAGLVSTSLNSSLTGTQHRSIVANVQGKFKSLIACSGRHKDMYNSHVTALANLEKAVDDAGFLTMCTELLDLGALRSIDQRALKTLNKMFSFVVADTAYDDYASACVKDSWTPPAELYAFFVRHVDTVRRNFIDNSIRKVQMKDGEDVVDAHVFEVLNEMRWLSTHVDGVRYPTYNGDDYGLMLGTNYNAVQSLLVLTLGATNVLRVTFGSGTTCDFTLGPASNTYWTNLTFVDKGKGIFEARRHRRAFLNNATSTKLFETVGELKEPKICLVNGVVNIRLPFSWSTSTARTGDKVSDRNKIKIDATEPEGKDSIVMTTTTKFAKPESFQAMLDYRNSTAAPDGYVYWVGFDYGENDNVASVFRARKYNNSTLREYFDVADSKELVTTYRFHDYQVNKIRHSRGDVALQPRDGIVKLTHASKYLRRFIANAGRCARGDEYYAKARSRLAWGWLPFFQTFGVDAGDYGDAMDKLERDFGRSQASDYSDVTHDPNFLLMRMYKLVRRRFNQLKEERRTRYGSQHQNDYAWITCVDSMCSLLTSISSFGAPPTPRGAARRMVTTKLHIYRDNVIKQYRKELAAFLRDACLSHDARMLAIEALKPTRYSTEDSDTNRKRALFAPAELQNDICLACDMHDIAVIQIDESMTSKVAADGSLGWRGHGYDGISWKHLHVRGTSGDVTVVNADDNAASNIVTRAMTSGASHPRLSSLALTRPGAVAKMVLAYYAVYKRDGAASILDAETIDDKELIAAAAEAVAADLGGAEVEKPRKGKAVSKTMYVSRGVFISAEARKETVAEIEKIVRDRVAAEAAAAS